VRAKAAALLLSAPLLVGLVSVGGRPAGAGDGSKAAGVLPARFFGASIGGLPSNLAPLGTLEAMVGRRTNVANWYVDFTTPDFDAGAASALSGRGTVPMITWEPWDSSLADPLSEPAYNLGTIIAGNWDHLLTTWATEIAAWGRPVLIRFAHEMNGNWYPWSEGVNGNTVGQYVQAWQHVHNLFAANGAGNVTWIWSPNTDYYGSTSLKELYPGDSYVSQIGLDGYNWGTTQSWSTWQSAKQIFTATIADVRSFTSKPILLSEVASAEKGGSKATWVANFFSWLESTPAVTGFVWFEFNKETDWRVVSSRASEAAFVSALNGY